MRKVSAVNNLRGSERSTPATSLGCDLAKDKNCRGLTLWRAIRWVLRYRNIVSFKVRVSVNPIISPVSILARNSSHAEKYCSSLRRKYRKIFASIKIGVWEGRSRKELINAFFLFGQQYNLFKSFMADNFFNTLGKFMNNLSVFFLNDLNSRMISIFHRLTLSIVKITYGWAGVNGILCLVS